MDRFPYSSLEPATVSIQDFDIVGVQRMTVLEQVCPHNGFILMVFLDPFAQLTFSCTNIVLVAVGT